MLRGKGYLFEHVGFDEVGAHREADADHDFGGHHEADFAVLITAEDSGSVE